MAWCLGQKQKSRTGFKWEVVGSAFWSDPRCLTFLTECQLPGSLSPASHPDDRRDEEQDVGGCGAVFGTGEKDVKFMVRVSGRVEVGETFSQRKDFVSALPHMPVIGLLAGFLNHTVLVFLSPFCTDLCMLCLRILGMFTVLGCISLGVLPFSVIEFRSVF